MKILVLGGNGILASHLKEIVSGSEWYFSTSKDADLRDYHQTLKLFKLINPTFIIHLAANVGKPLKNHATLLTDNILINTNVIKVCHECNIQRAIFCSSFYIFPNNCNDTTIDNIDNGPPINSNYGYAYAKRLIIHLCKAYNEQYNREYIPIIPINVYGKYSLNQSSLISILLNKAISSNNYESIFVNDLEQPIFNQYLYATDAARLIIDILFNYKNTCPLILTSPTKYTISEIIDVMENITSNKFILNINTEFNYKHIVSSLEFNYTSLEQGIQLVWNWLKLHYQHF